MTLAEFEAWWGAASAESVEAVTHVACMAMDDWVNRAGLAIELADLQPWRRSAACICVDCAVRAAEAAALAAAEVELVCLIWPWPLDRPLGQRSVAR